MKAAGGRTIDILDTIIAAGGNSITSEEIGQAVGIDHTGGHFSNTIGPLSTAGLITRGERRSNADECFIPGGIELMATKNKVAGLHLWNVTVRYFNLDRGLSLPSGFGS
jgi:hypothetical protein